MSIRPISEAKCPDLRGSVAAMQRAAELAREIAIQTNTGIVIVRDGQIVHVSAAELREEAANNAGTRTTE
ncbi:MAG: hypothetical protein KDI51_09670 [Xanthomonadales bacterium]|nr:hypothetical protein [Xanthomonadales bacterium]